MRHCFSTPHLSDAKPVHTPPFLRSTFPYPSVAAPYFSLLLLCFTFRVNASRCHCFSNAPLYHALLFLYWTLLLDTSLLLHFSILLSADAERNFTSLRHSYTTLYLAIAFHHRSLLSYAKAAPYPSMPHFTFTLLSLSFYIF